MLDTHNNLIYYVNREGLWVYDLHVKKYPDLITSSEIEYGDLSPIALSPDGASLAIVDGMYQGWSTKLFIMNAQTGEIQTTMFDLTPDFSDIELPPPIYAMAFSPDGKLLATGGGEGTGLLGAPMFSTENPLCVWEVETGKQLTCQYTHRDRVVALAFTDDGRRIITGSWDGTVRFWGIPSD